MASLNALVLGGNGFIGSHLVDHLLQKGCAVRVVDKKPEQFRKELDGVQYHYGDFGNKEFIAHALEDVEILFHLASATVPKTSNDDPTQDVISNLVGSIGLLEQCISYKIRKIVFLSSGGTVYGNPLVMPVSEDSPTNPICSYGIVKLATEKYLQLFNHLYGLDYVAVRPSNVYGERQSPFGIQGAIPVFLGKIARGETIEIWGDGNIIRDYLHISDLIDCIYRAAVQQCGVKVFNAGCGSGISINQLVQVIRDVTGAEVKIEYKGKRGFDVDKIYLDITKARQLLSWTPSVTLQEGILRTWEFTRRNV